jgi:hypothetical protein
MIAINIALLTTYHETKGRASAGTQEEKKENAFVPWKGRTRFLFALPEFQRKLGLPAQDRWRGAQYG